MTLTTLIVFFFPILGLPVSLYGIKHDFAHWRRYIFLLALFLAIVAYGYTPVRHEPDIVRYFDYMKAIGELSFREALTYSSTGESNLYLLNILLWIGGKINDIHLIPAISTFIVYYICFYITCDVTESEKINTNSAYWYVLFALLTLNYYGIVNNVRNVLALCLVGYAAYRDIYKNKRDLKMVLLYLLPVTLHKTSVFFILIRFIILIPAVYKYILLLSAVEVMPITSLLYGHVMGLSSSNPFFAGLKVVVYKAYWFYRNEKSAWAVAVANSGSQRLSKIIYITMAVVFCIVIYMAQKSDLKNQCEGTNRHRIRKYSDYVFCVGVVTIACAPMPMPEYWRFMSALIVLGGSVFVFPFEKKKNIYAILSKSLFVFTPIALMLWLREFIKCDRSSILVSAFVMNPLVVFFKDLIQLIL